MNQLPSRMLPIVLVMTGGCAFASPALPKLDCARKAVRPKLLIALVDGVRSDALAIAGTPRLLELASQGALSLDTRAVDIPKSGPGWSTVFTGVWRDRHRVDSNSFTFHALDEHPDLIARLEREHPELTTSFVHSWPPLHRFAASADRERDCTNEEDFDGCSLDESLRELGESDVDVMVVYLRGVDEAGHAFGFHPDVPEYLERLRWIDAAIGKLIDRIRQRCTYGSENWLVLAMTDHGGGGGDLRSHGVNVPIEREVFSLIAHLGGTPMTLFPAPAQVDFAPTALAHFGVAAPDLDGRVLADGRRPEARFDENLLFNPGAELDRGQETFDVDGVLSGWDEDACGAAIAYGSEGAPSLADVDPPADVGRSFFAGASRQDCAIRQRIDVSALDLSGATFEASALLGGFEDQEDSASVVVRFGDRAVTLGPIDLAARSARTRMMRATAAGAVPPATKEITVEVHFSVASGVGDGYADNLSLVLRRAP